MAVAKPSFDSLLGASVKSSMIYPAQALFFLPLTTLKNYCVALLCANFLPCQEQKFQRLNRNITLDLTRVNHIMAGPMITAISVLLIVL